jgi:hypothetical protein
MRNGVKFSPPPALLTCATTGSSYYLFKIVRSFSLPRKSP